ncbi:hypothetical protein [Leptothoe spongobia]|uniref:Uncharacterized protein n=1 Tax=Leptothoe spongobia TAU-MAC 1115 TaxID=1967444 RepID=A0A947DHL1_9CYAN|nr:hypothetical protein [Leptothoe spongobia]MBT9317086.1 hypothetical protein [Leptothoe spongobia TAU-MAC 1115]
MKRIPAWIRDLGIDSEILDAEVQICKNLGFVYKNKVASKDIILQEDAKKQASTIAASNFRRAAAHSLLIGNHSTFRKYFYCAAESYARSKMLYAFMMSAFDMEVSAFLTDIDYGQNLTNLDDTSYQVPPQAVYPLLFYSYSYQKEKKYSYQKKKTGLSSRSWDLIRENLETYRSYPIGVLGIQIGSYLDLADALRTQMKNNYSKENSIKECLLPFLESYNRAVKQTMKNRYHWKRLAVPFHPAEPDIFSVLLIVSEALVVNSSYSEKQKKRNTIFSLIESLPLASESHLILARVLEQCFRDFRF